MIIQITDNTLMLEYNYSFSAFFEKMRGIRLFFLRKSCEIS